MSRTWRAATGPRVGCATVPRGLSTIVHPRLMGVQRPLGDLSGGRAWWTPGRAAGERGHYKGATGCPVALAVREARDQRALAGSSEDQPQRLGRCPGASHGRPPCWLEPRFGGQASLPTVLHGGAGGGLRPLDPEDIPRRSAQGTWAASILRQSATDSATPAAAASPPQSPHPFRPFR